MKYAKPNIINLASPLPSNVYRRGAEVVELYGRSIVSFSMRLYLFRYTFLLTRYVHGLWARQQEAYF